MVEILHFKDKNLNLCEEAFALHLPNTEIKPVSYDILPGSLKKLIKDKGNCGLSFKINHQDESTTLVAEIVDFEFYVMQDRSKNDRYLGEGAIFIQSSEDDEIPVVANTFTSKIARRHGLGTRRLFIMNALSHAVFDNVINSSDAPRLSQKAVWEKLVEQEVAETHYWQGVQRYRFIS